MLKFDEDQINRNLKSIPVRAAVAFALSCAERLKPIKIARERNIHPGSINLLQEVFGALWQFSLNNECVDFLNLRSKLQLLLSNEEQDILEIDSIMDDGIAAMMYALSVACNNNSNEAIWAARRAYDAADRIVQQKLNSSNIGISEECFILSDVIVQQEIERQQRDLNFLCNANCESLFQSIQIVCEASVQENILDCPISGKI
jgi:hypothetical protein